MDDTPFLVCDSGVVYRPYLLTFERFKSGAINQLLSSKGIIWERFKRKLLLDLKIYNGLYL